MRYNKLTRKRQGEINVKEEVYKDTLDRDGEKYARLCEQNIENGKRGGRPKKQKTAQSLSENDVKNPIGFKKADNDNGNGNENENENENDIDIDSGSGSGNEYELCAPLTTTPTLTEEEKEILSYDSG